MKTPTFRIWDEDLKIFAYFSLTRLVDDPKMQRRVRNAEDIFMSTGMKDAKGEEIFEGDLVRGVYATVSGEVIFRDGGFKGKFLDATEEDLIDTFCIGDNVEIIGNIYKNKELL